MNGRVMAGDDRNFESITIRLRSTADLAGARRQLHAALALAGVGERDADDAVLAVCELLTNALEAADPDSTVTAVASVSTHPRAHHGARRIEVEIINIGEPLPGRLEVDGTGGVAPERVRGRGLVLAARMGDVTVEGLIGGTRARFRQVAEDDPGETDAGDTDLGASSGTDAR